MQGLKNRLIVRLHKAQQFQDAIVLKQTVQYKNRYQFMIHAKITIEKMEGKLNKFESLLKHGDVNATK